MTKINLSTATQTINLGKEIASRDIDVAELVAHDAVTQYIFNYGLKQMLNDVHAGVTKTVEPDDAKRAAAKNALVDKKLASLLAGQVASERTGGGDPVQREMLAMAKAEVKAGIAKIGKKLKDFSDESLGKAYAAQLTKHETIYREKAIAKLAIKPETGGNTDDIMALFA